MGHRHLRFYRRGVIHSWATDEDNPTEAPRFGRIGKQRVDDTGPLTKQRLETCDEEFVVAAAYDAGNAWLSARDERDGVKGHSASTLPLVPYALS